ncbi:imidazoleglycerol-phosphate dehydratase HisB [Tissierella praeacuta]|uniref:imidazoleglycerol-phosphate dehydratase HisB n=1 Tax=Tissierella praeacuta TaxID=43131 RepID=UPI001C12494B|nr:imidazoleglycerol-phosphate dehydratase HisB [Tissierella praeacuta]MBU5257326.1 imidazoleglycerol-phosphate dehydratase HisB [Tissierella praeacuta]
MRKAKIERKTKETDISVEINIDGTGENYIDTGIGFFDHMLQLMAFHGSFDLNIVCKGDLHVDDHHSVEDVGIALGEGFCQALGDKKGIKRYGNFYIPMDEALCLATLDVSGRSYSVFNVEFEREKLGSMSTENFKEFFRAFSYKSGITVHINLLYGENDHHKIEAVFKAFSKALKEAIQIVSEKIPSSKGIL